MLRMCAEFSFLQEGSIQNQGIERRLLGNTESAFSPHVGVKTKQFQDHSYYGKEVFLPGEPSSGQDKNPEDAYSIHALRCSCCSFVKEEIDSWIHWLKCPVSATVDNPLLKQNRVPLLGPVD